jgi:hypothetical protein
VAKFLVRDGATTVGAVRKATEGGLLVGCFEGRMEEGKRTEVRRRRAAPLLSGVMGSRGRGKRGSRQRVEVGEAREGGPSPD